MRGWSSAVLSILPPSSHHAGHPVAVQLVQPRSGGMEPPLDTGMQDAVARAGLTACHSSSPWQGQCRAIPSSHPAVHRLQGSVTRSVGGSARLGRLFQAPVTQRHSRTAPRALRACRGGQRIWQSLATDCHLDGSFWTTWEALGTETSTVSLSVSIYSRPLRQSAHHFSNSPAVFSVPNSLRMLIYLVFSSLYFSLQFSWNVCQQSLNDLRIFKAFCQKRNAI